MNRQVAGLTALKLCRCLMLIPCIGLAGCAEPKPPDVPKDTTILKGSVTLDGQPVNGTIQIFPTSGGDADQGIISNGKYSVTSRRTGVLRVEIRAPNPLANKQLEPNEKTGKPTGVTVPADLIPPVYNDKSTLTADVQPKKENVADFVLKSKP